MPHFKTFKGWKKNKSIRWQKAIIPLQRTSALFCQRPHYLEELKRDNDTQR